MNLRPDNGSSDEELLKRSAAGDRQAFEHLYDRYREKLVWFAQGFTKDRDAAEDVVQDVFITVIEKPFLFAADKRFSTWIYTIAANRCRNLLRDEGNRREKLQSLVTEHAQEQQGSFDRILLRQKLGEAVAKLNADERLICHLRFEEHQPVKAIAGIMQKPEGTIKSSIFHLLKKLSNHLKAYNDAFH